MKQLKKWLAEEQDAISRRVKAGKLSSKTARGKLRKLGVRG